jgi:hypothetical protein
MAINHLKAIKVHLESRSGKPLSSFMEENAAKPLINIAIKNHFSKAL